MKETKTASHLTMTVIDRVELVPTPKRLLLSNSPFQFHEDSVHLFDTFALAKHFWSF
ncbi:hypothetical protein RDWZM_005002 [Blomia tropicalis]|uniref:Uncharacterized protein n=1 Tax=Blomia tropicalis TaxID=40697 RepID=A0A9Q0RM75_BLOTA|nr:hypothetical protein RDWZM_005002 [Blomia tropicalis]